MKLKASILTLVTLSVAIYYFSSGSQDSSNSHVKTNTAAQETSKTEQAYSSYSVVIESAVLAQSQAVLTHSSLSWQMHLGNPINKQGLLTIIEHTSNGKKQAITSQLPFEYTLKDHHFSDVNLLELPSEHTLNVLPNILNLLSYSDTSPLKFKDAHGSKTYVYQRNNDQVTRKIQSVNNAQNVQAEQETEQWSLTLNSSNMPVSLNYASEHVWRNNDQQYQVVQKVSINQITSTILPLAVVKKNQNAQLIQQVEQQHSFEIIDEASMYKALTELQASLDPKLAKHLGAFLLAEYDVNELTMLIEQESSFSSAIIYALQKEQSPLAEQMLADLLTTDALNTPIKQKLLIALGRFGASSHVSFNTLTTIADKPNNPLAETALLNLGSMAKFTPSQSRDVAQYLTERLNNENLLNIAVLATQNSKNTALYPKVANLLHHQKAHVQMSAIKLLTSDPNYHDQVVLSILEKPSAQSIDAFTRIITDSGVKLTDQNKQRLRSLYLETENPIIKKRLQTLGINPA